VKAPRREEKRRRRGGRGGGEEKSGEEKKKGRVGKREERREKGNQGKSHVFFFFSIGVIYGKMVVAQLAEKLGLTFDKFSINENGRLASIIGKRRIREERRGECKEEEKKGRQEERKGKDREGSEVVFPLFFSLSLLQISSLPRRRRRSTR